MRAKLIQLFPFGITMTDEGLLPLLLLKSKNGELTLPVSLNTLEAGVTLSQSNKTSIPLTPHKATEVLLKSFDLKITKCIFTEVKPQGQIVKLMMENHPRGEKSISLRAEEAMSLCLHLNVPFFASHDVIMQSRTTVAAHQGQLQNFLMNPPANDRKHPYLM